MLWDVRRCKCHYYSLLDHVHRRFFYNPAEHSLATSSEEYVLRSECQLDRDRAHMGLAAYCEQWDLLLAGFEGAESKHDIVI